ncbi:hypothetical protein [Leisingera caerulea]|uniref:hypothetical protein n=1 Tax=Leisingera caerulea TaxID=506591 RepID=UPI003F4AD0D2
MAESRIALWLWLMSSGAVGSTTAWVASLSSYLSQFGAFAWILAGLLAATLFMLIGYLYICIRYKYAQREAVRNWETKSDAVNPLSKVFEGKRIKLSDLADPFTNRIEGKTFRDCELMGPCTVLIAGHSTFSHLRFAKIELIEVPEGRYNFSNIIVLYDCEMIGGTFGKMTVLVSGNTVDTFRQMGIIPLTDPQRTIHPPNPMQASFKGKK